MATITTFTTISGCLVVTQTVGLSKYYGATAVSQGQFNPSSDGLSVYIKVGTDSYQLPYNGIKVNSTTATTLEDALTLLNSVFPDAGGSATPTLTATYIGYGDGSNLLTGGADFVYDVSNSIFSVGFGGSSYLNINQDQRKYSIGDFSVSSNGNLFQVDDDNSLSYYDNTAHTGKFGINTSTPSSALDVVGIPEYANRTAALAGGLTAGAFYSLPISCDNKEICIV